jgi:hypothetical protein
MDDPGKDLTEKDLTELEYVQNLLRVGIEAFRLTREYVGEKTLPEVKGWSWFDWVQDVKDYFGE